MTSNSSGWMNQMTCAEFRDLAGPRGVSVKETRAEIERPDGQVAPINYLSRMDGEVELSVPLPSYFAPNGRGGVWRVESICRRLRISTRYEGWGILP